MGCYYTLCLNTYGYSLLFYKVYHEEGECRQLEFWLEKEQILETYSAQLQKSWNSTEVSFGINKNYWAEKTPEGAHTLARRVGGGRSPPYWACPLSPGPPGGPPVPIFCYMKASTLEKNHKQAYGTKLRCHEAEPWQNQSRAPAELFCRGSIPLGGGNHHRRHHHRSSHREGVNLHQHLH